MYKYCNIIRLCYLITYEFNNNNFKILNKLLNFILTVITKICRKKNLLV